jgi:hypothetical protein
MPFKQGKTNAIIAGKLDTLHENADHCNKINKRPEEVEDKEIEETSAGREEGESTGETSKIQETMVLPLIHEPWKLLGKNQHIKLK